VSQQVKRPRLWVPGSAWVSEEREVVVGPHAGFNGHGEAFRRSPCGHQGAIRQWRHRVWLVERRELTEEIIEEHAIILAESPLDPHGQPAARRWLSNQPLVCVSGTKRQRLADAGLRVYTVEHGVATEGEFAVAAEGGKRAQWELRGVLADFLPDRFRDVGGDFLPSQERLEVRTLVDRLLCHMTRGVLREQSVANAMAARSLVEPGYGYHGATDGVAATLGRIERDLRPLDALFAQVYARAASMRDDAREIHGALAGAPDGVEDVSVPIYGSCHREDLAELRVRLGDGGPRWLAGGQDQDELVLPRWPRWIVTRVASWSPKLPVELDVSRERATRTRGGVRSSQQVAAVMVMVLIAFIIAAVLMVSR